MRCDLDQVSDNLLGTLRHGQVQVPAGSRNNKEEGNQYNGAIKGTMP